MPAKIEHPEVAFPYGEAINVISNAVKCTIHPFLDSDGNPLARGEIRIIIPYDNATTQNSETPKERLFSVCNKLNHKGEIFRTAGVTEAKFIIDHTKTTSNDPELANKQLHITITGDGPKKNSIG